MSAPLFKAYSFWICYEKWSHCCQLLKKVITQRDSLLGIKTNDTENTALPRRHSLRLWSLLLVHAHEYWGCHSKACSWKLVEFERERSQEMYKKSQHELWIGYVSFCIESWTKHTAFLRFCKDGGGGRHLSCQFHIVTGCREYYSSLQSLLAACFHHITLV